MLRINSDQFKYYTQQIDDIQFFQGDTVTIPFQFIDYDGDPIPLIKSDKDRTTVEWRLCPYGQPQNPLLKLESSQNNIKTDDIYIDPDTDIFYVNLSDEKTKGLIYGKYMQQVILHYDFDDGSPRKDFLRAQGFVLFKEKIQDYF